MACPGLPQSCGSPRGQQGPQAGLGRGRARTSWALQSPRGPGTVGNKLRKPSQGKSPNRQAPPRPPQRCHHNSSCDHSRKTNWPRVLPWGTPEAESKPGKNPHGISWLMSTAKENKNDLASDQCREPRKQKHDPGDEKRNETSGGPSRNLLDVAGQPKLAGRPTLAAGPWPSARLSPPQGQKERLGEGNR